MDLSLVIPVYNARDYLAQRLATVSSFLEQARLQYEIIPVDDGSEDGSGKLLEELRLPHLRPVRLPANQGKFGAIATGMLAARGRCCVFTDADVPFELEAILYMQHLVGERGFHVVVGDRTLPGSSYAAELGALRRVLTQSFSLFVRLLVTGGLYDTQCGLKAFRNDVAQALFPLLRERGFAGDVELLYIALKKNLEIRRIPVRLRFRGESTVRPIRDGIEMARSLGRIRLNQMRGLYDSERLAEVARQDYWNGVGAPPCRVTPVGTVNRPD
ncbi:MAG: glycosyltransferase [Deltaproteobacteria bacterium]|nr:glycosyltransferase [Deltaproteobacteria bacterium]